MSTLSKTSLCKTFKTCFSLHCTVQIAKDLDQDLQRLPSQRGFLLWCDNTCVLTSLESTLSYARKRIDHSDTNVFLINITIVVGKYLKDMICILTEAIKELKNAIFVIILGVSRVQNPQEEIIDEDADCLLQVLSEVQKEAVKD
jgi:hypothetical protein